MSVASSSRGRAKFYELVDAGKHFHNVVHALRVPTLKFLSAQGKPRNGRTHFSRRHATLTFLRLAGDKA